MVFGKINLISYVVLMYNINMISMKNQTKINIFKCKSQVAEYQICFFYSQEVLVESLPIGGHDSGEG
jgi:hypothetical protein